MPTSVDICSLIYFVFIIHIVSLRLVEFQNGTCFLICQFQKYVTNAGFQDKTKTTSNHSGLVKEKLIFSQSIHSSCVNSVSTYESVLRTQAA